MRDFRGSVASSGICGDGSLLVSLLGSLLLGSLLGLVRASGDRAHLVRFRPGIPVVRHIFW